MTNHEAVKRIKEHMQIHGIGQPPHIYIADALNLAIQALENPDTKWKSCRVELPKSGLLDENGHNKTYLVTIYRESGYSYRTLAIRLEERWYTDNGYDFESDETVIAWQTITPYQGGEVT